MVSSWTLLWTFDCNIQPMWNQSWFDWTPSYNQYKMYTDYMTIKEWDKVVCWTDTYIVKDVENWDWVLRTFSKVTMEKSRWN